MTCALQTLSTFQPFFEVESAVLKWRIIGRPSQVLKGARNSDGEITRELWRAFEPVPHCPWRVVKDSEGL